MNPNKNFNSSTTIKYTSDYSNKLLKNCGFTLNFFSEIIKPTPLTNFEKSPLTKVNSSNSVFKSISFEENEEDKKENENFADCLIRNSHIETSQTEKKIVDAAVKKYNSKHKSKYKEIYQINSINFEEENKNKLFHKCCFQGCGRTFSSSGWLKSHLEEHLKEIKDSMFSKFYEKFIITEGEKEFNNYNENNNNNMLGKKRNKSINNFGEKEVKSRNKKVKEG